MIAATGIGTAALAVTGGPTVLQKALAQEGTLQYINSNGVRLRSGAGLSYSILAVLNSGEAVSYNEQGPSADGYEWINVTVQSSGRTGYVASDFLSSSGGEDPGTPEDPNFPIGSTFVVDTVGGQAANVRSAPGTGSSVVTFVANGTEGEILGGPTNASGYRWFNVAIAGVTGYIADVVIAPGSGGGEPDPPSPEYPIGARVEVFDGPLNLRDAPSGSVITSYPAGTLATTTGDPVSSGGRVWYPVDVDDSNSGWFAALYIRVADDDGSGEPTGDSVRVVDGPLNLRAEPTTSASIVATLSTGTTAAWVNTDDRSFFADGYGWVQIQLFDGTGTSGWVAEDFITFF